MTNVRLILGFFHINENHLVVVAEVQFHESSSAKEILACRRLLSDLRVGAAGEKLAFLTMPVNEAGAQLRRNDPSLAGDISGRYDLILVHQICPNPILVGRAHAN